MCFLSYAFLTFFLFLSSIFGPGGHCLPNGCTKSPGMLFYFPYVEGFGGRL